MARSGYSRRRFLRDAAVAGACLTQGRSLVAQVSGEKEERMPYRLLFDQPAPEWRNALPIGNGRLGVMVFGEPKHERLQMNEETIWSGEVRDRNNPNVEGATAKVRQLLFAGKVREAEELARTNMMGVPDRLPMYQTMGDLWLSFEGIGEVSGYRLELDMDEAIAKTRFVFDGVTYTREVFSSAPDQMVVVRLTASAKGKLNFTAKMDRPAHFETKAVSANMLRMTGQALPIRVTEDPTREQQVGVRFCCDVMAAADGAVSTADAALTVKDATTATLFMVAATEFRTSNMTGQCAKYLAAAKTPYDELSARHVKDYQKYFRRADVQLLEGPDPMAEIPTDVRLKKMRAGADDPRLVAAYLQFGRYLLISSSRPGTLAANLQGIWNESVDPPWGSKFTTNINAQMNYWIAERGNLAELHAQLFDLMDATRKQGAVTAKRYYNARGFVFHHNTDIWGDSIPVDHVQAGIWAMGAAWTVLHLWDHYEYGGDVAFLKERAYPRLREVTEFLLDYLVEAPDGTLMSGPSQSPENQFVAEDGKGASLCMSPTMDNSIVRAVFDRYVRAAKILKVDAELQVQAAAAAKRLPPFKLSKRYNGTLQEWNEDYPETEPGHRHISHLWALYPDTQITLRKTPELAEAAKKSLIRRLASAGGATGWSRAWLINCFARLEDGDQAYANVLGLLRQSTRLNMFDVCGIKENSPFQIDGNLGAPAGMIEMLLQSHDETICVLPALPSAWPSGNFRGLRGRGGVEVDCVWSSGKATKATLRTKWAKEHRIAAPKGQSVASITRAMKAVAFAKGADGSAVLKAEAGATYVVSFV